MSMNIEYPAALHYLGVSERLGGVPHSGVPIISILLFRVLYKGPLPSETPISMLVEVKPEP